MMIVRPQNDISDIESPSMVRPVAFSVAFHVLLFVFAAVGLPFMAPDPAILSTPVSVEIMTIDEITQTDRAPKPQKKNPPAPPKEEPPKPAPSVTDETPPNPTKVEPEKREVEEPVPEPEPVPTPDPEPVKKEAEEPAKKPESKPDPPKKEVTKKPEEPAQDFSSLLKNLAPDAAQPEVTQQTPEESVSDNPAPNAPLTGRLTISEMDAFKRQIEPCWNVPSGVKYAENLVIAVKLYMNPDGSVRDTNVLDQGRYSRDGAFRAAADSALRAVRNPRCAPFQLPRDKYNQWKVITIRFDPRDML